MDIDLYIKTLTPLIVESNTVMRIIQIRQNVLADLLTDKYPINVNEYNTKGNGHYAQSAKRILEVLESFQIQNK